MDLIAYVGLDDNIYTVRPDGSDTQQVTIPGTGDSVSLTAGGLLVETINNWPTWSPDASKIAFTSYTPEGETAGALYVAEVPGGLPHKIFQDPPESIGRFVAPRSPHYIYWAPDSETIAFLAPTPQSLVLYLIDQDGTEEPRVVANGAPSYMSWSPDGRFLLHHLQQELSLFDTQGSLQGTTLPPRSAAFRAPSWAPDGKRIAFTDRLNGVAGLIVADLAFDNREIVTPIESLGVFLWSPTANELAFTRISSGPDLGTPTYDGLTIFDADTLEQRRVTEQELLAFFWSPDGQKLAYVTVDRVSSTISWYVSDREGNSERKLADFVPSREQIFTMFAFFDQYAYSNRLWSPDSESLVYVGKESGANGAGVDKVFVVPVDGNSSPRAIAEGNLAFWSPR